MWWGGKAKNCEARRLDEAIPRTVVIVDIEELREILDRERNRRLCIMRNQIPGFGNPLIQKLKAASRARIHEFETHLSTGFMNEVMDFWAGLAFLAGASELSCDEGDGDRLLACRAEHVVTRALAPNATRHQKPLWKYLLAVEQAVGQGLGGIILRVGARDNLLLWRGGRLRLQRLRLQL
jgi:hypothetical protein